MAQFPSLPLWTDAYLGDTTHLTTLEHGAYLLLLMAAWRSKECCLPNDDKMLARYCRLSPAQWKRIKPVIMAFFDDENGVLIQQRLRDEISFVKQKSKSQSQNAKARWLKTNETTDATALPRESQRNAPTPTPTPTHTPKKVERERGKPAPKPTSISSTWLPDEVDTNYAYKKGYTNDQIDRLAEGFQAYYAAATGRGSTAKDWNAKWRTWILKDTEYNGEPSKRKSNAHAGGNNKTGRGFAEIAADTLARMERGEHGH